MPEYQPIKRSEGLVPLSREHHEGLLFVWKIRQGVQKETEPARIAAFIQWFWQSQLHPHFEKEESLLLPFLVKKAKLKEQLLEEHLAIRSFIREVAATPDIALFSKLADALNEHIRFEERVLFNYLETSLTKEELQQIGIRLAQSANNNPVWEDEFWLRK